MIGIMIMIIMERIMIIRIIIFKLALNLEKIIMRLIM